MYVSEPPPTPSGSLPGGVLAPPPPRRRSRRPAPELTGGEGPPVPPVDSGGGGGGGGDGGDEGPHDWGEGNSEDEEVDAGELLRLGVGLWMAAIAASFLVFLLATASIVVGRSRPLSELPAGLGWRLAASTVALVASSLAIESARRCIGRSPRPARLCLWTAFAFGALFLGSQIALWKHLIAAEVFADWDGRAAALYVLTGLHGLHVVGGLGYQALVLRRLSPAKPHTTGGLRPEVPHSHAGLGLCAWYWHFLSGLWLIVLGALITFA